MSRSFLNQWAKWQHPPSMDLGVVLVTDRDVEWMIPWWWKNYSSHNSYPLHLMDIGISEKMKEWCRSRMTVQSLDIPNTFVKMKEDAAGSLVKIAHFFSDNESWKVRIPWFKKPLCLLYSPFRKTIYLDIDCEVQGPLNDLFELSDAFSDLGCAIDPISDATRFSKYDGCLENERQYNGGVIAFHHGSKTLLKWAEMCINENHEYLGDQEVLSRVVVDSKYPIYELPQKYNTFYLHVSNREKPTIVHWLSATGKEALIQEIALLKQLPIPNLLPDNFGE